MPFTLAHPAAVLPLRRTKLVFSALIIGSMGPDFPYFFYVRNEITWGHTKRGIFLFCLPASLAILWIFHSVIKRPLVSLAPEFLRKRIAEEHLSFRFTPISRFLLIVVSVLIGTFAHILWDGFTHDHGYFVKHWQLLATPVTTYRVEPLWRALQQGCSVLGVAVVALVAAWWWYKKPLVRNPVASEFSPATRLSIIATGVLLAAVVGFVVAFIRYSGGWKSALVRMSIGSITTGCLELLLFALVWRATHGVARRTRDMERDNIPVER